MKNHKGTFIFTIYALFLTFVLSSCSPPDPHAPQDAVSQHAMVATASPVATQVGLEILEKGGNAVDAAVAIAIALSIAEPNASGIGGGGYMVIQMADSSAPIMLDYREMAPGMATPERYYAKESTFEDYTREGPMSIGVPGLIAGADQVLKKYGTMSLAEVLEPAIRLCRQGITVSEKLTGMITDNLEKILTYPATAKIYLEDMLPLQPGSRLTNPDLAKSLERIAEQGVAAFYEGALADSIVAEVKRWGGILSKEDLRHYQPKWRKPLRGTYRDVEIITSAPSSGGGLALLELLKIMERFDVKALQPNSAGFIHLFTEAMKLVYADVAVNGGDPDFYNVPVERLLSKEHIDSLVQRIDPRRARFDYQAPRWAERSSISTSHLSVVDASGNIVALTQSINFFFGSGIVASGTGILLNNHLNDFSPKPGLPNSIEPHKRPMSNTAPTIVLKNGKPFMTLGSPGGKRIISTLAQIIMNVVDFNMSMDEAIEAPRVHCIRSVLHLENRFPEEVISELKKRGHNLRIHDAFDKYFGGAQGILIDPESGKRYGGADSRRDGVAKGF